VRSFEVVPDNAALAARGVTLEALQRALEANNRNDGAGRLSEGEESLVVRAEGAIRNLDDVRAVVVSSRDGQSGARGRRRHGAHRPPHALRRRHAEHAGRTRRGGAGPGARPARRQRAAGGERRARQAGRAGADAAGGRDDAGLLRPRQLVERAVGTVSRALLEAIVLVVVLLVLFLGNLRAAVVALILPLAALITFILMRQFGMSANLMSLGGLAIAIGMLVDAAVVVVENIVTHLAHESGDGEPAAPPARHLPRRARGDAAGGLRHHRSSSSSSCRW
jgi:cobalt-zinc-cadmium resistance protein CzcA